MRKKLLQSKLATLFTVMFIMFAAHRSDASHAMGADITYECLGGNTYKIRVSFYRDCIGIPAPLNISVNVRSASCGQNFNVICNPIPGTGQEVTALCPTATTTCNGGVFTGIQEWVYEGIVNLPMQCTDWQFSWTHCCRNAAINTITTPGSSTFYIYANLDNTIVQCNNSPTFTNKPVPFACLGQQFQFNHGAVDADGDSLVYSLVDPHQTGSTLVNYIPPYTASDPLSSSPALQFNTANGDIVFNPQLIQVTVMAVLVQEYRNGVLIGSVVRDIQVTVINCSNNLPTLTGMNGTTVFDTTICANTALCFDIFSNDLDAGQNLTLTWNNGIDSGSFSSNSATHPTGTFCWTPVQNDISPSPYCFTVRVNDDACPYIGAQTYSYCVTVTGVNVNAGPDQYIACSDQATITASVINGTPPYSYLWSNGFTNPTQTVGIGTYLVTVTDARGCTDVDTVQVISAFEPTAAFTYIGNCVFGPIQFFDQSTTPAGIFTSWLWLFGDGGTSNLQNPIHTYNVSGTYNVSLIVENIFGCIDTVIQPVFVAPLPVPNFTVGTACVGSQVCFTNTTTPASTIDSVWWNFGNGSTSQTGSPCVTFSGTGTYSVTLIAQDTLGCVDTMTQSVTIHPLPAAGFINSGSTCQNSGVAFTDTSNGGVTGWWWNFGDGTTSTSQNPVHIYNNGGLFNPVLVVTNQFGCTDTVSSAINVNGPPFVNAGPDVSVCLGSSVTLTANGGVTYNWNPGGATTGSITVFPSADTTYIVSVTDANGCSATDTVHINVLPLPIATVSPDVAICSGNSTTLTAGGGVTYNWSPTGSTTGTITVSPVNSTTYAVDVINGNGCQSTAFVNVTVHPNPATSLPPGVFVCNGSSATLNPGGGGTAYQWSNGSTSQTITVNQQGVYTVTVTNQFGCTSEATTTVTMGGQVVTNANNVAICQGQNVFLNAGYPGNTYQWNTGATTQTINVSNAGIYSVTVTDASGCSGTISTTVNVNSLPVADFTPNDVCINDPMNFTDISTVNGGSVASWNWDFGDGNVSQQQNPSHVYQTTGTYSVVLTVSSNNGCVDTVMKNFTVFPLPVADFSTANGCEGTSISFNDLSTIALGNLDTWQWHFGDGNSSNQQNPSHIYSTPGTYLVSLYVSTAGGCADSITQQVVIYPAPAASFSVANSCVNAVVPFNNTSVINGGVITSYNWNLGNGQSSSQQHPSYVYTASGTYNVTLTVTSSNGCTASIANPVVVSALPTADAGNNISVCRGTAVPLTGYGGGTYNWSTGETTQVINVLPTVTTWYYVTVTNTAGCTAMDSVRVSIKNLPNADAGLDKSICIGGTTSLLAAGGTSYVWNPGGLTGNTITVSPVVTTQYIVTVTGANGCLKNDTVQVNVNPLPIVNAGPDQTICSGTSTALIATGGSTYYWSHNGATTSTVYVNPVTNANYIVTVTDTNGCINNDTVGINVNPTPLVSLASPGFFCAGNSITLDAGNPGNTYLWIPNGETTQTITVGAAGTYSVSVTNSFGCIGSGISDVFEGGTGLLLNSTNVQMCAGGVAILDAGNPGMIYQWSTGDTTQTISVTAAGIYNVTVTETDTTACSATFGNNVIVNPIPQAGFNASTTCLGSTTSFIDTSTITSGSINSWNWNFGNGLLGNSSNASIVYSSAGNYNVSLTVVSGFGCRDSATIPVAVNPLPTVDFSATNACDLSAVQFTDLSAVNPGTINNWSWNFGNGQTSSIQNPSYTYATPGTYNVALIASTNAGCSNIMMRSVTINPVPEPAFNAPEVCEGDSTAFYNYSTINNGAISDYTWDFGDGFGSTLENPTHIYSSPGTYNVSLMVGSDFGCIDTLVQQVTVNAKPIADFTTSPVCGNAPVIFNDVSNVSGSVINGWSWSFGDSTISNAANPSHIYSAPATYVASLIATSAKGCSDTVSRIATVNPVPNAGFQAQNACVNAQIQFTDTSSVIAGSINSWQWNFGDGNTSATQHPSHNYTVPGTYTVELIVGCATGCSDTITQSINVYPVPSANFTANSVCENNMTDFFDQSQVTGGGTYTYNWNFGDTTTAAIANPSHLYQGAGIYNVTLSVITPFGCTSSVTRPVSVYEVPVAGFTIANICEDDFAQLNDASTINSGSITMWNWTVGDGSSSIQAQNVNHIYPNSGTYAVSLTVTSNNGCSATYADSIAVYQKPSPAISTGVGCVNEIITLSDTSSGTNNIITTYNWNFGIGGVSNASSPSVSFGASGNYPVTLTTTNQNGCTNSTTASVVVNPLPNADFDAEPGCAGSAMQFDNNTTISNGGISGYLWNFGDGTGVSGATNPTYIYSQPGTYNVTLIAISEFGCVDTIVKQVIVNPLPVSGFTSNAVAGCGPITVQFNDTSSVLGGTIVSWLWDFGDGQSSTLQNPSHVYTQSGIYNVSLTVTSNSGCVNTFVAPNHVTVYPGPDADFEPDPASQSILNPTFEFINYTSGGQSYYWTFGDGGSSTVFEPNHTYPDTGNYLVTLWVTNSFGCIDTVSKPVRVEPEFTFFIPNAFTPNEDGTNEGFNVKGWYIDHVILDIFNRWGDLVYHSEGRNNADWIGQVLNQDQKAPEGVYVYDVKVRDVWGKVHAKYGYVNLVR